MSIENDRSSTDERKPTRTRNRLRDRGISDETDDDNEQVPPPAKLLALFVIPLLLLMVWAFTQS